MKRTTRNLLETAHPQAGFFYRPFVWSTRQWSRCVALPKAEWASARSLEHRAYIMPRPQPHLGRWRDSRGRPRSGWSCETAMPFTKGPTGQIVWIMKDLAVTITWASDLGEYLMFSQTEKLLLARHRLCTYPWFLGSYASLGTAISGSWYRQTMHMSTHRTRLGWHTYISITTSTLPPSGWVLSTQVMMHDTSLTKLTFGCSAVTNAKQLGTKQGTIFYCSWHSNARPRSRVAEHLRL